MMEQEKRKILIVEDDKGLQKQLKWSFDQFEVIIAENRQDAIKELRRHEPAVVTLDLGLPPDGNGATEGLATLTEIVQLAPHTKVIVVTGNDDRENAVKAVSLGAYDFYQKPVDAEVLQLIVNRAYALAELEDENRKLKQGGPDSPLDGVVASSPEMLKVCRTVEKIAPVEVTSLLLGESGTGKEVIAKAIHQISPRADNNFVAINCAAIPENLLESELFGYEKGAFTGAAKRTIGKIEHASNGTLFLDEIGDLPMSLQAKLLRFLQERVIERLGGRDEIPIDVRVVCATNQNLEELIKSGGFREDLYYRVSEVVINLPPLRERKGDAVVIAKNFLNRFAAQYGRKIKGFSPDGIAAIEGYSWPGNVRELENKLKRSVVMADGEFVTAEDLELDADESLVQMPFNLRQVRDEAERGCIVNALAYTDGNISQAAELLGVTRPTLYTMLNKYGLG